MQLFNRTIILWAAALGIAALIVKPQMALLQRVNNMNEAYVNCLSFEQCADIKSITEAREYYRILAQLYPDYGRGFEMEGICYLILKQDNMAVKKFREAIGHNPRLFWVSFELGKAYYRQGKYAPALKYFREINAQDNQSLLNKATLSNLNRLPDQTRKVLMMSLIDFVNEIKLKSSQMTIGCLIHQNNLIEARNWISLELNHQPTAKNNFFIMAYQSMDQADTRNEMLKWIDVLADSKPILHPWGHVIQPLKEILY